MSDAHRNRARRGEEAKRLLENSLLQEVYAEMDRALFQEWQNTGYHEAEKRESLYRMYRSNREHRHQLEIIATTGKASAKELTRINDQSKLRRALNV